MSKKEIAPRCNRTTAKSRVSEIIELLVSGYSRGYIIRFAAENWNIKDRQADDYILEARKEIESINEDAAERTIALICTNLWHLFREHLKNKSYDSAKEVLFDIAKLRGLNKDEMHLHITREHKDVSDDELDKVLGT